MNSSELTAEGREPPDMSSDLATDPLHAVCLLAVRRASGHFWGRHNIRSRAFESLVQEYHTLSQHIAGSRARLVEELYAAIPLAKSPAERHALLQVKRKISNFVVTSQDELSMLDADQRTRVHEYSRQLQAREALLSENRQSVFQEIRAQIETLIADEEFRQAVDYSCPWLIEAHRRHGPGNNLGFSNEERGIYSYAMRFFSKANPFHTFASVAFPPYLNLRLDGEYETLVHISLVLQLEQRLLTSIRPNHNRFIAVTSFRAGQGGYDFFIRDRSSFRRVAIKRSPPIQSVIDYLNNGQDKHTLAGCLEYATNALAGVTQSDVEKYLSQLIEHRILQQYLITDFDRFSADLLGVDPGYDSLISAWQHAHVATRNHPIGVAEHVGNPLDHGFQLNGPAYFINTYSRNSTIDHEQRASRFYPTLRIVKPLFHACNNFSDWAYVSSAFLRDKCAERTPPRVSYFELLSDFLHDLDSVISRYQASSHSSPARRDARQAWLKSLAACRGSLTDEQVTTFLSQRPRTEEEYTGSICFNGPVDAANEIFYPHNFFAGNGRYLSRYLLGQTGARAGRVVQEKDLLDVQIVPAYEDNRFYVAPVLPSACGFDARYRHKFAQWINLAEVTVELQDGRIIYRDTRSRQALRFHFFGFVLGQALPPEYQLLLTSHADFFHNPFEPGFSSQSTVEHVEPVYYHSVCLRREQWRFPKAFFEPLWREEDILRCCAMLFSALREAGLEFTKCYFEILDIKAQRKPRYLDMCNPLCVHVLRRAIRTSSESAGVSFTRMEPSPENLPKEKDLAFVTELMIEA